jgi:hypothetical protein
MTNFTLAIVLRTAALSGRWRLDFITVGQDGRPNLCFFFHDVFVDQNSAEGRSRDGNQRA